MALDIQLNRWLPYMGLGLLCAFLGLVAGARPELALGVALGLGFGLIAFANITVGLVLFVVIVFLEFVLPGAGLLTKVSGLILALSWFAKVATEGDRGTVLFSDHPAAGYFFGGFIAWAVLSLLWATSTSAAMLDLSRYLLVFVLVVIVFTAVRTRETVMGVIAVFIAGAAITALYAIAFSPSADLALDRVTSTVGNANVLASILVAGLVLALAAALAWRGSPLAQAGAMLAAVICVAGLFTTGSRSGAIAFAVAILLCIVVAGRWRPQALIALSVFTVAVVVSFLAFAPPAVRDRVGMISPGEQPVTEGRTTLWQVGGRMIADKPVTGVGVGNFRAASKSYVLQPGLSGRTDMVIDEPEVVHNVFMQIAAELGIIGLSLFLAILGYSISCMWKAAKRFAELGDRAMELISRALIPAVVAILVTDFFASEQFNKLLWLLVGLGPAVLAVSVRQSRAETPKPA